MFKILFRYIRLLSNARKEPYLQFYRILGFYPDNISYYQLALHHSSAKTVTNRGVKLNNERLEFLGDAILNSVVTDILFRKFENQREGFLTNTRSKIVKRDTLNQIGVEIGLDKLIVKSKSMNVASFGNNIYGNAFEALIGAIYLDLGYKKCKYFVEKRLFKTFLDLEKLVSNEVNYKSKIIEFCQKNHLKYAFHLVDESIDNLGNHLFISQLMIQNEAICSGKGSSKKESQQQASQFAFDIIKKNPAEFIAKYQTSESSEFQPDIP